MSRFLLLELVEKNRVRVIAPVSCTTDGSTYYAAVVNNQPPWYGGPSLELPESALPSIVPDEDGTYVVTNLPSVINSYAKMLDEGIPFTSFITVEERLTIYSWTKRLVNFDWPSLQSDTIPESTKKLVRDWLDAELNPFIKWMIYQNIAKYHNKAVEALAVYCYQNKIDYGMSSFTSARSTFATYYEPPFKWVVNKFFGMPVEDGPAILNAFAELAKEPV